MTIQVLAPTVAGEPRFVVHGIDKRALGDRYDEVRATFLRSEADLYVFLNSFMDETDWHLVRTAQRSGASVMVTGMRSHAPANTDWIDRVIL